MEHDLQRNGNLTKGKFRQYLLSTLSMSAALYMAVLVDGILVGSILGSEPLAAVNLCNPIAFASNAVFCILIYGGSTAAAAHLGGRDQGGANRVFTLSLLLCIVIQVLYSVAGIFLRHPIATGLLNSGELFELTEAYMLPLFAGIPIIGVCSGLVSYARMDGFTKLSAAVPIVANIVNLVLDYVFMKILGFGIASAGWATVIGYVVGCLMLIPYLTSKKRNFRFTRPASDTKALLGELTAKGLPTSLTNVCSFVRTATINTVILSLSGSLGIQIMAVCVNVASICNIMIQGTGNTILPIAGVLYGEKDRKGILYTFRTSMVISTIFTILCMAVMEIWPEIFATLFGLRGAELMADFVPAFRVYALSFLFANISYQFRSLYQATGNQKVASVATVIEGAAVIVPLFIVVAKCCPNLVWASFALAEAVSLGILALYIAYISKKKKLSRFLLLNFESNEKMMDVSIRNSIAEAEQLSEQVMRFCEAQGVDSKKTLRIAAAAEEMTVNIAKYAYPKAEQNIDVTLRVLDKSIVLKIRDDGVIFNPLKAEASGEDGISGIDFVKKVASSFTYHRVLGFNVTVITIDR